MVFGTDNFHEMLRCAQGCTAGVLLKCYAGVLLKCYRCAHECTGWCEVCSMVYCWCVGEVF